MPDGQQVLIEEEVVLGKRLGRHIDHRASNRAFSMEARLEPAPLRSKIWWRSYGLVFDQGNESSCVWQTVAGIVVTSPARLDRSGRTARERDQVLDSRYRFDAYRAAQELDPWPGGEPTYYGTSVEAGFRLARDRGLIDEYRWDFSGGDGVRAWLSQNGPVGIGITWWSDWDTIPSSGLMPPQGGRVRGGHAMELLGINVTRREVWGVNSWGPDWGHGGRFRMTWETLDAALADSGEAAAGVILQ